MVNNKISSLASHVFNTDVIVTLILSLLWPSLGLLFVLFRVLTRSDSSEKQMLALMVGLTFFLSYINSTKIASSDTIHYLTWYSNIDRSYPVLSFLFYRGDYSINEPLFTIISIIINYLTLGSETGYLFLCTFLIYSLQFYSIYIVAKHYNISNKMILVFMIMLAFFNPLFIQTVHALRQMIATSFLMMAIANRIVTGKNSWALMIMAFLTHMSVMVYLPILILSISYKKMTVSHVLLISGLVYGCLMAYNNIGNILGGMNSEILSAAGEKILNSSEHNDMDLALRGFYMYCTPFALLTCYSALSNKGAFPSMSIYYYLFIITFCVVANPISSEISIRYSFYEYSFFPLTMMAYYLTNRISASKVLPIVSLLLVVIFFMLLSRDKSYESLSILLFKPLSLFL